ncbi:MAG: cadmium-translocating P-type ATPase [Clostridia bacterium]|nr:cadmium-translocating P-type ATPase [Clostridia bacterium]
MKKTLQLEGLDCPVCAGELEREIAAIEGVSFASITFVNQKLTVEFDSLKTLQKIIDKANHFEEVRVVESGAHEHGHGHDHDHGHERGENHKKEIWQIAIAAVLFALGFLFERLGDNVVLTVFRYIAYVAAYLTAGYSVLIATGKNIAKGKIFDENFLMTVASVGALFLGEIHESVLVMLLYQTGELLQGIAVGSSRNSIAELMDLKSEFATRITENGEHEHIPPERVRVGDVLQVKAGEKVPVDGVLLDETAELDTKSLTGEAPLKVLKPGDELLSGCINAGKVFTMKVTRPYEDSAVGKILDLVENSAAKKASPEKFITKFARIYTPVVCLLAIAIFAIAPLLSYLIIGEANVARYAQTALTFLVISCPCALVISVPLTYFSGIGACAKNGILVKGSTYLDLAAKVSAIAFDKTGTLTEGDFKICGVRPEADVAEAELLSVAATLEKSSSHPIAKAFSSIESGDGERVEEIAGKGLKGLVSGETTLVGNAELLKENGVEVTPCESLYTLVCVAKNGRYLGAIEIGDALRAEAKTAVEKLKKLGIERLIMLTGDNPARATKIANEVGVYEVNASLLPDEKLKKAEEIKKQNVLFYVGDGVNDAPVMTAADCSASMGSLGSAAAVEASDFVLISDNLGAIPKCIKIARKTRSIVKQNIVFSIFMKVAFMALGLAGVLPLWLAVFADVGVMLLAVLNSLRMRSKIKE